jgi:hypothetical protein
VVRDETILLVEDDADDELLTRRALRKNNVCNDRRGRRPRRGRGP